MNFATRLRLYLLLTALLPPILMTGAVYLYAGRQHEEGYRRAAVADAERLDRYHRQFRADLAATLEEVAVSDWFSETARRLLSHPNRPLTLEAERFGLDFLELLDSSGQVLVSAARLGLIGEKINLTTTPGDTTIFRETMEWDLDGSHPTLVAITQASPDLLLYGGRKISGEYRRSLDGFLHGHTEMTYVIDKDEVVRFSAMEYGSLYLWQDTFEVLVAGSQEAGFYLLARFDRDTTQPHFTSYFNLIILVALASVLVAAAIGLFMTNRLDKEINNLVHAFSQVAEGDLGVSVMAYREGEFAQLADAFSEMMQKLQRSRRQLVVTEKIAAWESVSRKIAHEVRNPLTPISISADDLRRSWAEKLPNFDQTLDENTRLIKTEVARLRRLLDEFVGFARMRAPQKTSLHLTELLERIRVLYRPQISSGHLTVSNKSSHSHLEADLEQLEQLLVNLIKNGLESKPEARVELSLADADSLLAISVRDDGPGFTPDALTNATEPYFTTKSGGSGLGLVIAVRIVHDHGGTLEIRNHAEGGAVVDLLLPLS